MCKLSLAPILYYGSSQIGNSTGDEKLHTAQEVDGLGRQNETRQYVASTEYISVTKTFDALQRVASVSNPYQTDTESAEYTATAYDGVDRPSTVTTADTSQTSYSYSGNTATVTDPAGNKRTTTADAFGRTTAVTEDPSGLAYATSYIYDVLDDLTSVAQGTLAARSFTYDSLKRLMKSINPESCAVCYGTVSQGVCSESYDKNGNLTSKTDARSAVTTFTYDALNRLKGKSYSDSVTPWVAYTYDTAGYSNSIGRLTIVQAGVIYHDILAYDSLGHVASDELAIAPSTALQPMDITSSQAFNFSYKYKRSGALWQETYPSGRMITVDSFDGAGRPTSVGPDGFPAVSGILYASHGPIKQRTLGNGLTETMTWDPTRLQQTALSATLNGSNLLALNYYYCTGNAASCTTKSAWDAVPGSQTNYFYLRGKALNWAENNVGSSAAFWPYGQPLGGGNGVFATYQPDPSGFLYADQRYYNQSWGEVRYRGPVESSARTAEFWSLEQVQLQLGRPYKPERPTREVLRHCCRNYRTATDVRWRGSNYGFWCVRVGYPTRSRVSVSVQRYRHCQFGVARRRSESDRVLRCWKPAVRNGWDGYAIRDLPESNGYDFAILFQRGRQSCITAFDTLNIDPASINYVFYLSPGLGPIT